MDTHKKIREHISAFADGASAPADVDLALAALQGEDGRQTWGRSTIVGPWGEIIAKADHDDPCVLPATLDLSAVQRARQAVPSLLHDRDFDWPQ